MGPGRRVGATGEAFLYFRPISAGQAVRPYDIVSQDKLNSSVDSAMEMIMTYRTRRNHHFLPMRAPPFPRGEMIPSAVRCTRRNRFADTGGLGPLAALPPVGLLVSPYPSARASSAVEIPGWDIDADRVYFQI